MKQVREHWTPQNEYTRPLEGRPYYINTGVIQVVDSHGDRYSVGEISYERFDDQNFQYVISPFWSIIDALPSGLFQGIPGIDMNLRLQRYYRVNMTPIFVSERTPGEGREDLWNLLRAVGLDYYDRFEWLLRTKMRYGNDNLIVERVEKQTRVYRLSSAASPALLDELQYVDCVEVEDFDSLATSNKQLRKILRKLLQSGAKIRISDENRELTQAECSAMLRLLLLQEQLDRRSAKAARETGIQKAKQAGKYTGRKKIAVDANILKKVKRDLDRGIITVDTAMKRTGIKSKSTLYRRFNELK